MFNNDNKKINIRINTGLTEEQTHRLIRYIITYSIIGILWTLLAPSVFLGHSWLTTLVFYLFVNPIAVMVICRFFAQDNEGGSNLFLVLLLIEIVGCFLVSDGSTELLSEYWWVLIIYFICGKIGMKLY